MNLVNLANLIPSEAEPLVLELVERLGKLRAHPDDESLLIESIVRKQRRRNPRTYHRWSVKEDRELLSRQHLRRGVADYAHQLGITETAAWSRLRHLRNLRKGKRMADQVEG